MSENSKVLFRELSPKTVVDNFKCEECSNVYENKKSLTRHIRTSHEGTDIPSNLPAQPRDEVTCQMCNVKTLRTEIKRHLRKWHHIPDCQPGHILTGFESQDSGQTWFPLFVSKSQKVSDDDLRGTSDQRGTVVEAGCSREITETSDDNPIQTGSSNYLTMK